MAKGMAKGLGRRGHRRAVDVHGRRARCTIVPARHTSLAFSANSKTRWYTPNPIDVRVPAKLVLHVGFAMPPAAKEKMHGQKSRQQTTALAKGARVLSEEDHELIMEELHARDMGEDEE